MEKRTDAFRGSWIAMCAGAFALALALVPVGAMAQAATNFGSASGVACPGGNVLCNGSINFLTTELFFEPEVPPMSLKKGILTWFEIEQLFDNPYQVANGAACDDAAGPVPGTDQGFPTYCTPSTFLRRPTFSSVVLPPLLIHPLNYNPPTGTEMRILNRGYTGGTFNNTNVCYTLGAACVPPTTTINVTSGASRMGPGQTEIDYDVAIGRKLPFCQVNPEPVPLSSPFNTSFDSESLTACGSDPGEPGAIAHFLANLPDNMGFPTFPNSPNPGVTCSPATAPCNQASFTPAERTACVAYCNAAKAVPTNSWYSTPAVPGITWEGQVIPPTARMHDPERNPAVIQPRNLITGNFGLHKPTLRVTAVGGNGINPNYLWNSTAAVTAARPDPTGADTQVSNENDFVGLYPSTGVTPANYNARKVAARLEAMRLGKSLFWDMQVGSDGVQACGSCHAHAGADNRTKNQVNPNGADGIKGAPTFFDPNVFTFPPNYDLQASDFPLHKLADPEIAGDPLCTPRIAANVAGISFPDGDPPDNPLPTVGPAGKIASDFTVCDAANVVSDTDDVASSMGVHFGRFFDIPPIGAASFGPASNGVQALVRDLRSPVAADNVDPIPGFAGVSGNDFRRVEPRNTPTIFLADVNFDNFWDGRARHDDNGGSVFGIADPQAHVFADQGSGTLTPTRQLIRFSSIASLAKGPALSKFEMSFDGRNWAKIGKKLLQAGVTPLANQLVDTTDSVLGPYSNQGGSACAALPAADRSPAGGPPTALGAGVPGLCISYPALIRHAFYPALHQNTSWHLDGCYTDGRPDIHPNQCVGTGAIPILDDPFGTPTLNLTNTADPFDGYVLTAAAGAASATDTNQFTQMEGNFSLFWGQSIHLWVGVLVPDDSPFDQFMDINPDIGGTTGETGEPLLVLDLPNCPAPPGYVRDSLHGSCFVEVGNFKRDPYDASDIVNFQNDTAGHPRMTACIAEVTIAGIRTCTQRVAAGGTRAAGAPDPLLGMDIFFGSNASLKNPNFRSARCGECHAAPTLTDHTSPFTVKAMELDLLPEFEKGNPAFEPLLEPLLRERVISGFLLEDEIGDPGQDAVERRTINPSIAPAPVVTNNGNCVTDTCSGYAFPDGITINDTLDGYIIHADLGSGPVAGAFQANGDPVVPVPFTSFGGAFFDNGVYNLGVRPCVANQEKVIGACEDTGRGNTDAFGWPLSLAALALKDLGGPAQQPGTPIAAFDPNNANTGGRADAPECAPYCSTGGLFELTAQDQQINPGYSEEHESQLPGYLGPHANNLTVGDAHPQVDEMCGPVGGCFNTLTDVANAEGIVEIPFDPRAHLSEVINMSYPPGDATFGGPGTAQQGTWPVVNRVGRFGSFKAAQLREVELTGPYFHNGGKLTLRQVVDFYVRGGDFPVTNSQHRDFNMLNLNAELQSDLSEADKVALVDFLLELTDARVKFEKGPFDHPQIILPLDGTAPESDGVVNRDVMLTGCVASTLGPGQQACDGNMFLNVPAVGAAGTATPEPNFLGISSGPRLVGAAANCAVANNQYCH